MKKFLILILLLPLFAMGQKQSGGISYTPSTQNYVGTDSLAWYQFNNITTGQWPYIITRARWNKSIGIFTQSLINTKADSMRLYGTVLPTYKLKSDSTSATGYQTVGNFFPKGDTRYAQIVSGGYVPTTRTLTINGTTQDLSANRTWTVAPTGTAGGSLGGTYPNPTVVTNANLTGPVTSVGNATTINNINGITPTYYDPTSSIQTQLNTKLSAANNLSDVANIYTSLYNLNGKTITNQIDFYGKQVIIIGDSYTFGAGSTNNNRRYSTVFCEGVGAIEINHGIAGSTAEKRSPIDYQGAVNLLDRLSDIPTKTSSMALLVFEFGLNDMGQNGPNYTAANYITDYTTALNNALSKGWLSSQILMVAPAYIGTTGYNLYASITGNPAPTRAHHLQFVTATQTIANNFGTLYIDLFHDQFKNDTTLLATDGVHPNDAGHAFIGNDLIKFFGGSLSAGNKIPMATAMPLSATLGATYGNNVIGSGGNLKYKLYDDGVNVAGIGESVNMQEYQIYTGGTHDFFIDGVKKAQIGNDRSYFINGTNGLYVGAYTSGTTNGAIWNYGLTPSDTNYGFSTSNTGTTINSTAKTSQAINNVNITEATVNKFEVIQPLVIDSITTAKNIITITKVNSGSATSLDIDNGGAASGTSQAVRFKYSGTQIGSINHVYNGADWFLRFKAFGSGVENEVFNINGTSKNATFLGSVLANNSVTANSSSGSGDAAVIANISSPATGNPYLKLSYGNTMFGGMYVNLATGEIPIGGFQPGGYYIGFYTNNVRVGMFDGSGNFSAIGNLTATLPAYSSGTNLPVVYNSTNSRFETTTAVSGAPILVGVSDGVGQTTAITTQTYTVGGADASFMVTANLNITAITVDVIQTQVTYTDETNTSRTLVFYGMGLTSAGLTTTGVSNYAPIAELRAKAGTTITVATNLTTSAGSITYNIHSSILKIR